MLDSDSAAGSEGNGLAQATLARTESRPSSASRMARQPITSAARPYQARDGRSGHTLELPEPSPDASGGPRRAGGTLTGTRDSMSRTCKSEV